LEAWLEEHQGEKVALWVKIAKKHTGISSLTWEEMVDTVLCFGWIDGQRRGFDDSYFLQRTTPRRPRGLAEVEAERADAGRRHKPRRRTPPHHRISSKPSTRTLQRGCSTHAKGS